MIAHNIERCKDPKKRGTTHPALSSYASLIAEALQMSGGSPGY